MSSSSSSTVLLLLLLLSRSPVTISSVRFLLSLLRSITRSLIIFTTVFCLPSLHVTANHIISSSLRPSCTLSCRHSFTAVARIRSSFAHLIHLFHSLTYSLSRFLSFMSLTHSLFHDSRCYISRHFASRPSLSSLHHFHFFPFSNLSFSLSLFLIVVRSLLLFFCRFSLPARPVFVRSFDRPDR
jgi:hypothetical protein